MLELFELMLLKISRLFYRTSIDFIDDLIVNGKVTVRLLVRRNNFISIHHPGDEFKFSGGTIYVQGVYDNYLRLIDLEAGSIREDACIISDNMAIFLYKGEKILLVEVSGRKVVPLVKLGEKISSGSKLAMIFTGKREVRYYRSDTSGIVFYYSQIDNKPEKYLFALSPHVEVIHIE
ncbi:MAG: DUF2118 domain-containing protein [archaeon GB-1867-097]|nr:DUF2118 domain-containing protein [Candidatus Culexmicrobium thermophilum]